MVCGSSGDDIYISIDQGDSFQYDFPIPKHHHQGLYWYHPHRNPLLNTQIAGGMAGGIIIGDVFAPFPSLQGIPERVMLLKDLKTKDGAPIEDPDPNGPTQRTINGLFKPRLEMRPSQLEFWRIGNLKLEHLLPAQHGRADLLYHGDGRQPAEPSRGDANAPPAARQPARGARLRAAAKVYADGCEARAGIGAWVAFYNDRRPHQALAYQTPQEPGSPLC